jgi:hypothetical protein
LAFHYERRGSGVKKLARARLVVLGARALNRALLARQMLLERANMSPLAAIDHLVGLQAQVPTDPYFGLWSRLCDFEPQALSRLIETRKAVRLATIRGTLHLMSARDAVPMRELVQPALSRMLAGTPFGKATNGIDVAAVVAAGRRAVEKRPMTLAELRPVLAEAFPGYDATALSYVFHYSAPLVQVPPRGLWREGGLPRVTTAEAWIKPKADTPDLPRLVLRYLKAYGPASVADMQAWSGLTRLGAAFEELRPKLATFLDEAGRELFDLPDAPRPEEKTPAPPRFLPVYDNVTLGFANRERILSGAPPQAVPKNLNVRSFLIDGFVAGFWKLDEGKGKATLTLEPFAPLRKSDERAIVAEGRDLLKFAAPGAKGVVSFGTVY